MKLYTAKVEGKTRLIMTVNVLENILYDKHLPNILILETVKNPKVAREMMGLMVRMDKLKKQHRHEVLVEYVSNEQLSIDDEGNGYLMVDVDPDTWKTVEGAELIGGRPWFEYLRALIRK